MKRVQLKAALVDFGAFDYKNQEVGVSLIVAELPWQEFVGWLHTTEVSNCRLSSGVLPCRVLESFFFKRTTKPRKRGRLRVVPLRFT